MSEPGPLIPPGDPRATHPEIAFESLEAWETWLTHHATTATSVWIRIAKKASGIPTVTYAQAVDGALCHGWIDGQRRAFDDVWFLQRFTPRRPRSNWSKVNCAKVERLIEQGRMRPAGLRQVERARADGRWDAAYDPPSARKPETRARNGEKFVAMLDDEQTLHP